VESEKDGQEKGSREKGIFKERKVAATRK